MVTRAVVGKVVKRQAIEQSREILRQLPEKEREELALREAIFEMLAEIEGVLARGYSFDEVAGILSQNGVEIRGATLKQYLREARKSRSRKHSRSSAKSRSGSGSGGSGKETEAQLVALDSVEGRAETEGKVGVEAQSQGSNTGRSQAGGSAGNPLNEAGGKVTKTKTAGRTVGEFTEVPDDL
jgi:hypothetical protein